jgi:pilus assembly protein CpaF
MPREDIYAATLQHHLAPVRPFLDDPAVSEVMINGPGEIYIERDGQLHQTEAAFADDEAYAAAVNNVLQYTGQSLSDPGPLADGRLPDGSRVHVAKAPCARHGTVVSIRKFSKQMLDIDWLVELGALTEPARQYLQTVVEAEQNVLVAGGTSSGKTSLLNALSHFIPPSQRIVVIEDSAELQMQQDHVISLEARGGEAPGGGEVTIRELFRSSLRLRPDRIIIGEVRGGEALDMIQAMTSGHGGSMGTLHANSPRDAVNRLETLALMSEVELPLHALRAQASSAIDVIVQMTRQVGGRRLVTQVSELGPIGEDGQYQLSEVFYLQPSGEDDKQMQLAWTGARSHMADRLDPHLRGQLGPETEPVFNSG